MTSYEKFNINKCFIKMASSDELKELDIKNHTYYYFDDIIQIEDLDLNNFLKDEQLYENILVYNISYKTLIDAQPLHIRFDEIDGFVRLDEGTKYLVLFRSEKYDSIYNRIRYLISIKSGVTFIISHNYAKTEVDSYDSYF